ncbi:MAG: uroporphyrinogen-III C-methyltransferase [Eubacteriales bacterium]|nr:uroporphyrinogen-III C-methyltransferase [Eubacteriales bacterium]
MLRKFRQNDSAKAGGKVYLVGAGPGNPDYLSLRAWELLQEADLVLYDDLPGQEILDLLPAGIEKIYVGKRAGEHSFTQAEINRLILKAAEAGSTVLRLKGGDSFIFGRGAEEVEAIIKAGLDFELVPGIPSPVALASLSGIPLSERNLASSIHFFTASFKAGSDAELDYNLIAKLKGTLVFLMGVRKAEEICQGLIAAGLTESTPAAAVMDISKPGQRKVISNLAALAKAMEVEGIKSPAVIVIGKVCQFAPLFDWFSKRPLSGRQYLLTRSNEAFFNPGDGLGNFQHRKGGGGAAPYLSSLNSSSPCELEKLIRRAGGLVELRPSVQYRELDFTLPDLEDFELLIFTSPRAVDAFLKKVLREADLRALAKLELVAIGAGTARRLAEYHLRADFIPSHADSRSLAAELLERAGGLKRRCLIPRSAAGSKSLITELSKAYEVTEIPSYTVEPLPFDSELKDYDYIIFTSAMATEAFRSHSCTGRKALCIGEATAKAAKALGFTVELAEEPSFQALYEHLIKAAKLEGDHFA